MTNHDLTPVRGLDTIPRDEWPNVGVVFQTYHIMVLMWLAMVLITGFGAWFLKRGTLGQKKGLLWAMICSVGFPHVAQQSGWITAEVGRQPWIVWNQLRTANAVSMNVSATQVLSSIIMFAVIYSLLFVLFIFLLDRKIKQGPEEMRPDELTYRSPY